jgi:hypothetical protein
MKLIGKIIGFCLLLAFISSLWAEDEDEENMISEEPRFIQDESSLSEDPYIDDDSFFDDTFIFNAPTLVFEAPVFETRSYYKIFPDLSLRQKANVRSNVGIRNSFEKNDTPTMVPAPDSGIDLYNKVMTKKPSHIIEALIVLPYGKRELDLLDIYNALRNIKNIQDFTLNVRGKDYKIFQDTTRLESAQKRKPIPDPPPSDMLPFSETMYMRFVDLSMGDLYLRGDISVSLYGLTYSLTNFRDVSYSIFKVMNAGKFTAIIYIEPVKEGILVYSMSGLYIPSFVANRINLAVSMNYRITVLINWIADGLKREENAVKGNHFYQMQQE